MATISDEAPPMESVTIGPKARAVWIQGAFLNRVWAVLQETLKHPFTSSILLFARTANSGKTELKPSR
jgi:hypothetical protein